MLTNLNHITLAVSDIKRSFIFYRDVLQFKPICLWDKGAYFLIGNFWFCLNVDKQVKPDPGYTHYAFSVAPKDFNQVCAQIKASGAKIFKQNTSEGDSLYFLDPDGHKLEIHVGDWQTRMREKKQSPGVWRDIQWFVE
jgi:catechol 2,3-dioxygenase-like lactoylglutathione lyase family enzyme